MKLRVVATLLGLVTLTSCGSQPVATITSQESVINQPDGTKKTITPSPTQEVTQAVVTPGAIVSCRSVKFIEKPEKDLIINCLDGAQGFNVGAIQGPAIINVWGTWCYPCREELPIFVEYYKTMSPEIQLVGVDVEDAPYKVVQPFVIAQGISWPNFYDPDHSSRSYFGNGVPVTWFINSKNEVAYKKFGKFDNLQQLQELANQYLGVS